MTELKNYLKPLTVKNAQLVTKGLAQLLVQSVFVRSELLIKFVAGLTVKCFKNRNMCQASAVTAKCRKKNRDNVKLTSKPL